MTRPRRPSPLVEHSDHGTGRKAWRESDEDDETMTA